MVKFTGLLFAALPFTNQEDENALDIRPPKFRHSDTSFRHC
jgi:hypothetical protein